MAAGILAGDRRLHAVVEDLDRHAADRGEGLHVTAQQRLQVLMQDEARFDVTGMAEHQREQPDDAGRVRCVREGDDEAGEVDLGLLASRRLEADLVGLGLGRPDRGHEPLHRGVGPPSKHIQRARIVLLSPVRPRTTLRTSLRLWPVLRAITLIGTPCRNRARIASLVASRRR